MANSRKIQLQMQLGRNGDSKGEKENKSTGRCIKRPCKKPKNSSPETEEKVYSKRPVLNIVSVDASGVTMAFTLHTMMPSPANEEVLPLSDNGQSLRSGCTNLS